MPVIAMTKEMGSLGTFIGLEVARQLDCEFLRNDIIKAAAREYRAIETRLVGAVERPPRWTERLDRSRRRYRTYLEAGVLESAQKGRVLLMGRWSTIFLHGVRHAVRVRVCAPPEVRARRVMKRLGVAHAEAVRRITAYDEGVRARIRQVFEVDWTDPLLYDLVINTESVTLDTGVRQVLGLAAAPEFQPTDESRAALRDRTLAARVRASLKADAATTDVDLDIRATSGHVRFEGVVASSAERDAVLARTQAVSGVTGVSHDMRVFRPPV